MVCTIANLLNLPKFLNFFDLTAETLEPYKVADYCDALLRKVLSS